MDLLDVELERELSALRAAGLEREIPPPPSGADFVSNDYLGLARDTELASQVASVTRELGTGAGAARLLVGDSGWQREAERRTAAWLGADDALLFPSGYQANLGLLTSLARPGDLIVSDELNHASLIDGMRLSRARIAVFPHGDADQAGRLLADARGARRRLIVTESIFSMDGDRAPLPALAELCARYGAHLIIDEAHAIGVTGPRGAGEWSAQAAELPDTSVLAARLVTGGKALGMAGGLVVGSASLRRMLLHRARSFVFSTAPPPALASGVALAVERAAESGEARERVHALAVRLSEALELPRPAGAIVPVPVGQPEQALDLAARLREQGFEVRAVRPPTVPEGGSRLRLTLHATNTVEQVDALVAAVRAARPARAGGRDAASQPAPRTGARPLFVVGTDTGIGKTVVSALLTRAAARRGPVGYWKPAQTGDESDTVEVLRLCSDLDVRSFAPTYEFPLPASPHEAAREAGAVVDPARLRADLARHIGTGWPASQERPWLVVEPAGGLHVPLSDEWSTSDWLAEARPELVVVARSGLGTLNHTRLTVEALRARALEPRALLLVGEPHESNRSTLSRLTGLPTIEVPLFRGLEPDILDEWIAASERLLEVVLS